MTQCVGIIGHPVGHSLSPVFQGAAFTHLGLDVSYEEWDTPGEELPHRVAALREPGVLGANVTIPHKEAVIPLLDELSQGARQSGAVNTIVHRDGRLGGHNTDGPGFVAALRKEARFEPRARRLLLLGAGGAARGIAFALAEEDVERLHIWNRTPARAASLAGDLAADGCPARALEARAASLSLEGYDCVVNCTSVGLNATELDEPPWNVQTASPGTLIADIVYTPAETPLLRSARALGLPVLPGLPMLVYQGALGFELWTGREAPVDVMFRAAREELARREAARPSGGAGR
jgi:shikimate dehydrogenase